LATFEGGKVAKEMNERDMRIAVVGSSGSGKSTLAQRLASEFGLPNIELDAINWQAGWRDLNTHDPEEFKRRVAARAAEDRWVCDGNYSTVAPIVWGRMTHLVWLDYSRAVIMPRVIRRSLQRALDGKELWPGTGNRERFRDWLSPEHPIRWAWSTHAHRRKTFEATLASPTLERVRVFRLRRPGDAVSAIAAMRTEGAS
jgi:adenylate kinase family enzyme